MIRELKEEVQLNDNEFYKSTNTLIHNYAVTVNSEDFTLTNEIDFAKWYTLDEALDIIKPDSLAKIFLQRYLKKKMFNFTKV